MAGTHKRKSASGAKQWMECPGSLALSELVPAQEDTEYSKEGSAAHAFAEKCLRDKLEPWMLIGQPIEGYEDYTVDIEMSKAVQTYTDYIRGTYSDEVEMIIEQSIDNEELGPDFGGTADCVVHRMKDGGGFVHVLDYKHGVGVAVDIDDNPQLLYYAYGTLKKLGAEMGDGLNVGLTIVQPRAFHQEGPIRERWMSSDDILEWGDTILRPAMDAADVDGAPLKLGDHCRFCPAKLVCPKQKDNFEEVASADPEQVPGFSNEDLALQYEKLEAARMYIKAVQDECYRRAMRGEPVAGTKLVPGRADRKFKDGAEEAAVALFGDDAYTEPKVKSVAQIEKTCIGGKEFVSEWAFKSEPTPILVSTSDRRSAVTPQSGGSSFAGVSGC